MSKPNLLQFGTAVGFYRNNRIRDLHDLLKKSVPRKLDFAELAPMLFQVVMAYAAENQIDGDFSGYSPERWFEIFLTNHVPILSGKEASLIRTHLKDVGLFDGDKIRSWMKYNRHLADYEGLLRAKRKAAKIMHQKRELEARVALKNGSETDPETVQKPEKNRAKNHSPSKQLWLLEKALESAKGPARKELLAQKKKLLSMSTGVDLSEPPPPPALPAPRPHKRSAAEFQRTNLKNARIMIANGDADLLSEPMVKALAAAGEEIPEEARHKFPKLLAELGQEEAGHNPVPG